VSTEVASTRLPKEILREIDREASARGLSRSVYLAELIERSTLRDAPVEGTAHAEALSTALAGELREIRDSQRSVAQGLRDVQSALKSRAASAVSEAQPPLVERLAFSTFFSEALIKRVTALLHRNPGELSQVVREAREQAEAEARLWRERLQGSEGAKGVS
jgi:hypothetical protein